MVLFSDIGKRDCRSCENLSPRGHVADEKLQDFGTTQTCARKGVQHRQWMDCIVLETKEMGCYVLWEMSLKCCGMYNIPCFPSRSQNVKVCWVPDPRTCNIYLSMWETWILQVDSHNFQGLSLCLVDGHSKHKANWELYPFEVERQVCWD
jgi:hypothetical protein